MSRERVTVELDTDVALLLRERAAEAEVSEGEIVGLALRASGLRALVVQIRSRGDLDADAAMALAREGLQAARADASNRAA